jgi:hypothetical protein
VLSEVIVSLEVKLVLYDGEIEMLNHRHFRNELLHLNLFN